MIFEPDESILSMKIIDLEISERTHERKAMIVVGTSKIQGEDYGCGGSIYVFDIIQVVPEPEHPERNKVLKMIAKEDLRGPLTALSEVGDQGFLIAAQGQKIMARGLKEDNTLLPVAFLDVQTMVTSLKNVKGTGLVLVADAMKGLWLVGFSVGLESSHSCHSCTDSLLRLNHTLSGFSGKAGRIWKFSLRNFYHKKSNSSSSPRTRPVTSTS